jgi:hypothetical protein
MGLRIQFIFYDGRDNINVEMPYTNFHSHEICKSNEKSHSENMNKYAVSECAGTYHGEIVKIMYNNCILKKYITYPESDRATPVKAVFHYTSMY